MAALGLVEARPTRVDRSRAEAGPGGEVRGIGVDDAFARISNARRVPVPETIPQQRWVERVAPLLMAAPVKPPY